MHQFVGGGSVVSQCDFEEGVDVVVRDDFNETLAGGE